MPGYEASLEVVRFYLDENLSNEIAAIARGLGLDVVTSHQFSRHTLPDEDQLTLAAADGRCLVTANRDDFIRLTNLFFHEQRPHAGVLIVPRSMPTSHFTRIARALVAYAESHVEASTSYLVDFLS